MASSGKRARARPVAARGAAAQEADGYEINYTPHYEVLVKEGQ
jgi:hypothetical protein